MSGTNTVRASPLPVLLLCRLFAPAVLRFKYQPYAGPNEAAKHAWNPWNARCEFEACIFEMSETQTAMGKRSSRRHYRRGQEQDRRPQRASAVARNYSALYASYASSAACLNAQVTWKYCWLRPPLQAPVSCVLHTWYALRELLYPRLMLILLADSLHSFSGYNMLDSVLDSVLVSDLTSYEYVLNVRLVRSGYGRGRVLGLLSPVFACWSYALNTFA
ncbi:hypothetical protein C8R46DRAFT_1230746 [Mycena filopes]|nr:hypothetical protein C8R46DRAFT_1230746 [Mycena filopes]